MLKLLVSIIFSSPDMVVRCGADFFLARRAIKKPGLNYIEGWYSGDAARTESALHPGLAKRMVRTDPITGKSTFIEIGAMTLVQNTRAGCGRQVPKE
jgi:hypothetical protein